MRALIHIIVISALDLSMKEITLFTLVLSLFFCHGARCETVAIDYVLDSADALIEPFTIPNPQGGADITIAPSINLDAGSFESRFYNADATGLVSDGDASISEWSLLGSW